MMDLKFSYKCVLNLNMKLIIIKKSYFLITKNKNIKLIIFSLLILLFQFIKIFTYTLFFINIK